MKNISCILFSIMVFGNPGICQDPEFTLFDRNPIILNPALTGDIEGAYHIRSTFQYRTQWFDVLDEEFSHYAFSIDSSLPFCFSKPRSVSIGGYFLTENTPFEKNSPKLTTSNIGFTSSFRLAFKPEELYISLGMDGQLIRRYLNPEGLRFPTQFDGMGGFDPNAANLEENLPSRRSSLMKPSLGAGLSLVINELSFRIGKRGRKKVFIPGAYRIGGAVYHLNRPNLSLLGNDKDEEADVSRRWVVHARAIIPLNYRTFSKAPNAYLNLQPYFLYVQQGAGVWQSIFGAEIGFGLAEDYIAVGGGIRLTNGKAAGKNLTDYLLNIRWRRGHYFIASSVDLNVSPFAKAGNDRTTTAMEISLGYFFGDSEKRGRCKQIICPNF